MVVTNDPAGDQRTSKGVQATAEPKGDLLRLRVAKNANELCAEFTADAPIRPYVAFVLTMRPQATETPVVQLEASVLAGEAPEVLLDVTGTGKHFRDIEGTVGISGHRLSVLVTRGPFDQRDVGAIFRSFRFQARSAVAPKGGGQLTDCMPVCVARRCAICARSSGGTIEKLCKKGCRTSGCLTGRSTTVTWSSTETSASPRGPGSVRSPPTVSVPSTWRSGCGRIGARRSSCWPSRCWPVATGSAGGKLIPLAVAVVGFLVVDRSLAPHHGQSSRSRRRGCSELAIAGSVALTGGPRSPALAWLVIPLVTLPARFNSRARGGWRRHRLGPAAGDDLRGRHALHPRPPAVDHHAGRPDHRRRAALLGADEAPTSSTAARRSSTR